VELEAASPKRRVGKGAAPPHALGAFVHVARSGDVTIHVPKPELGQGVRTSLPMLVAEELGADWKRVRVVQADFAERYGRMGVGSSSSLRSMWIPMRTAGAAARAMLVAAASARWGVPAGECRVERGVIRHGARTLGFGDVAEEAARLPVPKDVPLKDPASFTLVGRSTGRVDDPAIVRGRAGYGIDVKVPGMLHAAVARSPVFGGKVARVVDTKARRVPGVRDVVRLEPIGADLPWAGVGVIADTTWASFRGRDALEVAWDEGPAAAESTASLRARMDELTAKEGKRVTDTGDVDAALSGASRVIEARYEVPYLAHAAMEPMNATAAWTDDRVEIWAPTQGADWTAETVASALKIPKERVTVHVTLLGGGFGRRSFSDAVLEAALLSRAAGGRPVKVTWTREDDVRHDYYRPPSVHRVRAALDGSRLVAWHHRMASPSINVYLGDGEAFESETGGVHDLPYGVPNLRVEYAAVDSALPRGWWRAVEHSGNGFVVQSFLDELAHDAGIDPLELQLSLLPKGFTRPAASKSQKDFPFSADRLRAVIELVRERSGWARRPAPGRARGFAASYAYLTYVAEVAEVSLGKDGAPRVHRVTAAVDCGTPVNPDGIAQQIEGGILYGLAAALHGRIDVEKGRVVQSNFHDYPPLRIEESPSIDVHIVPSRALPTGVGEPGLPPIAPAVANALFALTGKRRRTLPFAAQEARSA
jgi:isoquinoline 1-oxidoreductase beta subunit